VNFGPELFIELLPMIIGLLFVIYFLNLMARFVTAVENLQINLKTSKIISKSPRSIRQ
jgi:hypothetical protein